MAYLDDLLASDERVLLVAHRHAIFMILNTVLWLIGSIVLIAGAGAAVFLFPWQAEIVALVIFLLSWIPLAVTIYRFIEWRSEEYILTTYRIVQIEGIINKRTFDSSLEMINDVEMRQTLFGRLFNYGSIHIITGSDIGVNDLGGIERPFEFKRSILETKLALARSHRQGAQEADSSSVNFADEGKPTSQEEAARLVLALTELRNSGMISETEFDERIRQVTGRT